MHFESPWAFLLIAVIPAALYLSGRRRGRPGLRFSSLQTARQAGASLRLRLRPLPAALRAAALVLLVVALARPQKGREQVRDVSRGVAIEMVVDCSGSMGAEMEYRGERLNRLEVVKKVFKEFALGNGKDLAGRPNDLLGMIAFARYPDTVCPLTLAHGALSHFLDSVKLVRRRSEDGTAIGDAVALAAARLKTADEELRRQRLAPGARTDYEIKSKVIILLTDGQNNAGKRRPLEAAALAREWHIKIYAIGVGGGEAVTTMRTPFGNWKVPTGRRMDEDTLRAIAKHTGGLYRRADDEASLRNVYKKIDELEKSEIESVRFMDYEEKFPPFVAAGLVLILAEVALAATWLRRIP